MPESLIIASGALLAGATHVLVGADHVAALLPFALDARRRAWVVGLRWGAGHALGITGVGLAGYALLERLDFRLLEGVSRALMGIVLLSIGSWGLMHARRAPPEPDASLAGAHVHTAAAFAVGVVHGVAGTGSILGVLPAIAQPSWLLVGSYLLGFSAGTIGVMVGLAALLGLGLRRDEEGTWRAVRRLFLGSCVLCIVFGTGVLLAPLVSRLLS